MDTNHPVYKQAVRDFTERYLRATQAGSSGFVGLQIHMQDGDPKRHKLTEEITVSQRN